MQSTNLLTTKPVFRNLMSARVLSSNPCLLWGVGKFFIKDVLSAGYDLYNLNVWKKQRKSKGFRVYYALKRSYNFNFQKKSVSFKHPNLHHSYIRIYTHNPIIGNGSTFYSPKPFLIQALHTLETNLVHALLFTSQWNLFKLFMLLQLAGKGLKQNKFPFKIKHIFLFNLKLL